MKDSRRLAQVRQRLLKAVAQVRLWIRGRVPPGFRWPLGLVIAVGGVFGFLPVLGFWMIPLGLAVIAMDVGPLWRRMKNAGNDRADD